MPITADKRGYVAGKYGIELDGIMAGWVGSVEGGHATSDVVVEKVGPDHIAAQAHRRREVRGHHRSTCGTGMSKGFYEWIKASLRPQLPAQERRDHRRRLQLQGALAPHLLQRRSSPRSASRRSTRRRRTRRR